MATFNTYDYEFLIKCLAEGSLAFKSESIKRLTTLAQNDKKSFLLYYKNVLNAMQDLYIQQRDDINIQCTLLLSEIILNIVAKQVQNLIKNKHLKHLICNLGHATKPTIRKASHTSLLAYLKTYHNFDAMLEEYLDSGFENENLLIQQKSINSFQSIFILQMKCFIWTSENAKRLLQIMISKAGDQNLPIAKAAAQCLLSLCKNQGIKQTSGMISIGYLQKLLDFIQTTEQKLPNAELKISGADVNQYIEALRKKAKPQVAPKIEPKFQQKPQPPVVQEIPKVDTKIMQKTAQNLIYQRRLQKIKKSIAITEEKQKKLEKEQQQQLQQAGLNFAKILSNVVNEGSIKERTEAVEEILFKIQSNKSKPDFQASIKAAIPSILKLLKDPNPKIVSLTLKILQNVVQQLKSDDAQLQNLITVVIEKLGDQKISIRQIVSKVVRQLVNKTEKNIWIRELLESMKKNDNAFFKDESMSIILNIYSENQIPAINFPTDQIVEKIVVFTEDPKTKIKIRTLDCLAQIVGKSGEIERYNQRLRNMMSDVFYQMYLEKVAKFAQQNDRKNTILNLQKRNKAEPNTFRSTYQQNNYRKDDSEDEAKLNISLDIVKKRVSKLKSKRNGLSTRETLSLDRTYRTIGKTETINVEQDQISLPSLKHKTSGRSKLEGSPNRSTDKGSQYMNKEDLQPLADPETQYRNIMSDLKNNDWKIQFETTNKLRRIIQFHSQLIRAANNTNLHMIVLDLLGLCQSLRSSVSKNALICLYEIIQALGRQIDPQVEIILEKLMKKSADTNVFISIEVQKCLNALSLNTTPSKLMQKLLIYKDSKNFAIKDAFINTLLIMKEDQKIRSKQYAKLIQIMAIFLNEGQIDLRTKAKNGIIEICTNLGDWYRYLRGKVKASTFKQVSDLMTKNSLSQFKIF